ncbi:hypothetical protein [Mycoplasma sp. Sp33II]|uniref:hypothetical protein n=1 Tax=unclassified Mycoplasma TaxID=2683645 RepID=UPI003AB05596
MKISNFNKLSGTELRTRNILNTFSTILIWIKEVTEKQNYTFSDVELEKSFKDYCQQEGIYTYKDNTGINRFSMLISKLIAMGFITKKSNECYLNVELIDENNLTNSFFQTILKYGHHNEFNNMVKFIEKKREIKSFPLYLTMVTFEEDDDFEQLYKKFNDLEKKEKCIEYLAEISTENALNNLHKYTTSLNYKKPPKGIEILKKILEYKLMNTSIPSDFFQNIDVNQIDKYIDKNSKKNKNFNYYDFYNNLSLKEFILLIETKRLYILLTKEYFDIWYRWMKDFGFLNTKVDMFINSSILEKEKEEYHIIDQTKQLKQYPYKLEQVNEWLKQIDRLSLNEFKKEKINIFKDNTQILNATRATIAEYLVNLKFAYLLNIKPENFKKYSNTIVNNNLEPISHAPGGRADFSYFDQNKKCLINVETTLHNTYEELHNNETTSNIRHIITGIKEYKCSQATLYNIILSDINLKEKESYKEALNAYFKNCWNDEANIYNADIKIDSVHSFEWLYNLKDI